MDCSWPGSSVHGILQARILEWVAVPSFRGSSPPMDRTMSLTSPALAGRFFFFLPLAPTRKPHEKRYQLKKKKEKKRYQFPVTRMHISHLNFMLCNESLYTVLCSWHFVPRFFLMDISNFYGKCEFNSVPSRPSASFSTNVVFKNKKPTLGKKVIAICQFNKAIGNITS